MIGDTDNTTTATAATNTTTASTAASKNCKHNNGSNYEYRTNLMIDLFERNYCIFDHLVTFLDEVALFNLEETMKIDDSLLSFSLPASPAAASSTNTPATMDRRRSMSLLCWDQWHRLAQIDSHRSIPRWRPILDDDKRLLVDSCCNRNSVMTMTTNTGTHHRASSREKQDGNQTRRPPSPSPLQPNLPPLPLVSQLESDDFYHHHHNNNDCTTCRDMMLDRIRGRDFARNAIFVHSCEEAQQLVVKKHQYDVVRNSQNVDDKQQDTNHPNESRNQHMERTASCNNTKIHPGEDRKSPTIRSSTGTRRRQTPSSISTTVPSLSSSSSSTCNVSSLPFDFEECWREWFEATRSPYGGACGTYAFVRVTITGDEASVTVETNKGENVNQHCRRYWEGFRRLIWASWMDRVILDVHLVDLVQEMMGCNEELDKVLRIGSNHSHHGSSSPHLILKKLLDVIHVTVVVSGSLLVVTGGVNVGGTTGFVFCRPSNKDYISNRWNGTTLSTNRNDTVISQPASSPLPTMTAIPVKLSPDTFNHEVNIQVGMHPNEDFSM